MQCLNIWSLHILARYGQLEKEKEMTKATDLIGLIKEKSKNISKKDYLYRVRISRIRPKNLE